MSDNDLKAALDKADVPAETATAIVQENSDARLAGLRSALSVLAVIALLALFPGRRLPARQPSAAPSEPAESAVCDRPTCHGSATIAASPGYGMGLPPRDMKPMPPND